ncbi:hypothetical protein [Yoonia sp.]|uniref:hypothetical protein n=1 Tax=Yoonia sp. TaxID=2212373 RepID=UPI0025E011F5|nr:hypothetical protein [Yoonia sp.]
MARFLFLCLIFAACTAQADVVMRYDDWTGFHEIITPEHEIFRDSRAIMTVRPVMIIRDGQRQFGILTNIRRRVPNGPVVETVHAGDIRLQYQMHDRIWSHCVDGCQRAEVGLIPLTEAAFRAAARTGLPLRVQGRRGRYHGLVPPDLLQQVLDANDRLTKH